MIEVKSTLNFDRLAELNEKIQSGKASKREKDELMVLLRENNSISQKQYDDYRSGRNTEDILGTALIIGGIVLLGKILNSVFND